jgi:hypothetical protein
MEPPLSIRAREELPPAILRTELPTLVWDTCADLQQVLVWLSVRWLLALNGNRPAVLTGPEIARVAGVALDVTQRCLALEQPDRPAPRSLVTLGLLEVETKRGRWGDRHAPREYTIPARIEADNLRATQAWLARTRRPQSGARPDLHQLAFELHNTALSDTIAASPPLLLTQDVPEELLRTSLPTIVRALAPTPAHVMLWLAIRRLIALSGRASVAVSTRSVAELAKISLPTARKYLPAMQDKDSAAADTRVTLEACGLIEVRGWVPDPRQPQLRIPVCAIPAALEAQNVAATRRYIDGGIAHSLSTSQAGVKDHDQVARGGVKDHDQAPDRDLSIEPDRILSTDPEHPASQCVSFAFVEVASTGNGDRDLSASTDQRDRDFSTDQGVSASQRDDPPTGPLKDHDHARDRDLSTANDRVFLAPCPASAFQCDEIALGGKKNDDHGVDRSCREDTPPEIGTQVDQATAMPPPSDNQMIPPAPLSEPALPAHPYELWALAHGSCSKLDRYQLHLFAESVNCLPTSSEGDTFSPGVRGYGWYWVGRAILEPSYEEGGARSVAIVRSVIARWKASGRWGAGLAELEASDASNPLRRRVHDGADTQLSSATAAPTATSTIRTIPASAPFRTPRTAFTRRPRQPASEESFQ